MESKGYDRNPFNPKLNQGWALPTTLMPSQAGADRSDFIRIDGHKDDQQRANTCVLSGFACGLNPVIPETVPPGCIRHSNGQPWYFVDFNSTAGDCNRPYGFYVAVYKDACDNDDDFCEKGGGSFGFFEAASASEGLDFQKFISSVIDENGKRQYRSKRANEYSSPRVGSVTFVPSPGENKYVWGIMGADGNIGEWPLAQGGSLAPEAGVITAKGGGIVTINNWCMQKRLILDMHDWKNPQRIETTLPPSGFCPVKLLSLTLTPTSISFRAGKDTSQGTITLDVPAPKGGAVIDITTMPRDVTSFLSFPPSVTIPPGQMSVSFQIRVINPPVPSRGVSVTFDATFRGIERKEVLLVEGVPE